MDRPCYFVAMLVKINNLFCMVLWRLSHILMPQFDMAYKSIYQKFIALCDSFVEFS